MKILKGGIGVDKDRDDGPVVSFVPLAWMRRLFGSTQRFFHLWSDLRTGMTLERGLDVFYRTDDGSLSFRLNKLQSRFDFRTHRPHGKMFFR